MTEPGRVVDQPLEGRPAFDDVLELDAGVARVVVDAVHVARPGLRLELREVVQCCVELVDEVGFERLLENQVTAQVEQVVVQVGRCRHGRVALSDAVIRWCDVTSP
jgi:hypothetical protein